MTHNSLKTQFLAAAQALTTANVEFHAGALSPMEHARRREAAMAEALLLMAQIHGVALRTPLHLNSNAEFLVVAVAPDTTSGQTAHFGEPFAALLTAAPCRTGSGGYATLLAENGWCYLLHFHAEKMVLDFAQTLLDKS